MQLSLRPRETALDLVELLARKSVSEALLGEPQAPVRLGRFELVRCLGQGGYGAVYEAREDDVRASVALKCLHTVDDGERSALRREFRAAQRLCHPNLVTLYELFACEHRPFFTMELVAGRSLLRQLAETRAGDDAIRAAFHGLLDALVTIHASGMVHRDLKPSNVLLDAAGRVVILDYGLMIAHESGSEGAHRGGSGTRSYMAPEQRSSPGPKVDVYAVGKMLAEALREASTAPDDALARLAQDMQATDPAERPDAREALSQLRARCSVPHARVCRQSREIFVGREPELSLLEASLARVRAGQAALVWIEGESGIGKSALLREFCARARSADALVLEGRCYERENSPFKVFDAIASALARWLSRQPAAYAHAIAREDRRALARLLPELTRALHVRVTSEDEQALEPGALRQRASAALHLLLSRLAAERPVVIALDDLQWGDADSAGLMLSLLAPALPKGVLIVGAYRGSERESSPFLRRVLLPARAQIAASARSELTLQRLTADEVRRFAVALDSSLARDVRALDLLSAAGGMPFLLRELVSSPELRNAEEARLERLLEQRLQACSGHARELLRILCIAGRPLSPRVAVHAARLDHGIWPSANELCAARLARWRDIDEGRELEPYHDIVRRWVAEREPDGERPEAHRRLAEAVDLLNPNDVELALTHWLLANEHARARRCALHAATQARSAMAWTRAADLYRLALNLSTEADRDRAELHESLGDVLVYAGEHAAAGDAYECAASAAEAADAVALRRSAASQLLLGGRTERGVTLLLDALTDVGESLPNGLFGAYRTWSLERLRLGMRRPREQRSACDSTNTARCEALRGAYRGLTVHDPLRGAALHMRYLHAARGRGDAHEIEALAWEAAQRAITSGPRARSAVARIRAEVHALVLRTEEPYANALSLLLDATYRIYCCERPRDALVALERAKAALEHCPGSHFEQGWLSMLRDYAVHVSAEVDLHAQFLARARESQHRHDAYTHRQLLFAIPLLHLLEDRPEAAVAYLEQSAACAQEPPNIFQLVSLTAHLDVLIYRGRAADAYALLRATWSPLARSLAPHFARDHLAFLHARNAVALYAQTQKPALAQEANRHARVRRSQPRLMQGLFHGFAACLAIVEGDIPSATRLLRKACAALESAQHDNLAVLARYRLAQLTGDAAELARALGRLRALGVRAPERWVSLLLPAKPPLCAARDSRQCMEYRATPRWSPLSVG